MSLQPMDAMAWITVAGMLPSIAIGVIIFSTAHRFRRSRVLHWFIAVPGILLIGAPAFGTARIVNRFVDYDRCVTGGAAKNGASAECPQWTANAYAATTAYREI